MKFRKVTFTLFLIALTLLSSCKQTTENDERIYLDKNWQYSLYGEKYPFYDISVENFSKLSNLIEKKIGYIFLKSTFTVPSEYKHRDLALFLGRVKIASKIYINGHQIGKTGNFPPHEFTEGNKSFLIHIPREYLNYDAENSIMICLWCHAYGSIESTPFIAEYADVETKADYDSLVNCKIYLVFTVILLIIFLIYLFLYLLRRSETENLTFSLLCLFTGLYLCTFYYGDYSFLSQSHLTYLQFEKFFKGACALITGYLIVGFTRDFMHYKESVVSKITRLVITITATIIPFTAGNIVIFRSRLRISFLFITIQFLYIGKIFFDSYRKKDKRLNHYFICIIPFILAFIVQIILKVFFGHPINTLVLAVSWITVIFLFLSILIIHFVQLANEVEFMNRNLEELVTERTEDLEKEKNRAIKELDLAGFVQRNFYKFDASEIKDWEFQYIFEPMAGVSGDLYIAFISENHLNGVGIFDISGHGIASGLVTMLVKNIIEKEFKKGLELPLNEVMANINARVIREKGNIENYLTGLLIRFNKDDMELVNAGHPKAILYNAKKDKISFIENEGVNQYGTIGIPDFPVNFETVKFNMEKDDELILYTDGITECTNSQKKYFGTDGILNVIQKNIKFDLEKQVNALSTALYDFSGTKNLNDDITYIILKKK